jgi:hypothetical protein
MTPFGMLHHGSLPLSWPTLALFLHQLWPEPRRALPAECLDRLLAGVLLEDHPASILASLLRHPFTMPWLLPPGEERFTRRLLSRNK